MPNRLLKRIQEIDGLRDRIQGVVQDAMAKWDIREVYKDRGLLADELIPELLAGINRILQDARKFGSANGRALLEQVGGEPTTGNIDFGAMAENRIADTAADCLRLGEQFLEDLNFEAEKMGNQGVGADSIVAILLADWNKRNRGQVSGKLWAGLARRLSDLATRLYDISQNAAWFGQDMTNGD